MTAARRRALVVAYCFPPHAAIGTHRTLRLVAHLAASGWAVDVLTAKAEAYLPGTPTEPELLDRIPSGVRVIRSGAFRGFTRLGAWVQPLKRARAGMGERRPAPAPRDSSRRSGATRAGLKTTLEELCAMPDKEIGWYAPAFAHAVLALSGRRPDVIFSSAPPWTTHVVAGSLASAYGCPWVADFRDPWVRSQWTRYRSPLATAIARRLEQRVVHQAKAVVFTTETARHEFASYYGAETARKFHVVFNGCEPMELQTAEARAGDEFVVLHAGSLYGGRNPLPLLNVIAHLRAKSPDAARRLRVRFLGSTSFPGLDLPGICRDLDIANVVEFLPRVARDASLQEIRRASALLILQAGTTMAIPGKLYEYIAAGRPVLALCEAGEMARFIRANRLGIVAHPADAADIERGLLALLARAADSWGPVDPSLFDGRLRAAELAGLMTAACPAHVPDGSRAADAAPWGHGV